MGARRLTARWLVALLLGAALVAGCGGSDGGGSGDAADVSVPSGSSDDGGGGGDGGGEPAEIVAADMPEENVAEVTVDGETYTFRPQDPTDTRLYTCDLSDSRVVVNMQTSEGNDLLVQIGKVDGQWLGSIVARPGSTDRHYQGGRSYSEDSVAIDGSYFVWLGPFQYNTEDDLANFRDAGDARIAVTCP